MKRWMTALACAALLAACGGGEPTAFDETPPPLRVEIDPAVLVARQNESVTVRVDVPDVPDDELPSGYAFDLDEVAGRIDVTTAQCPAGAGSRACQDWTITPRADSAPGRYDVGVKTSGSRAGAGSGSFELTVVASPSPAHGAAVAVAAGSGHVLVLDDAGRVFTLGANERAQSHAGYRRLRVPGIDPGSDFGTEIFEPGVVSEFVEAPLPAGRWLAIAAARERSYAVREDGSVWAWGSNRGGAFGFTPVGDSPIETSARPIPGLADVRALLPGEAPGNASFALRADGSVWFWQADVMSPAPLCEEFADTFREECRRFFTGVRAMARSSDPHWAVSQRWPDGFGLQRVLKNDGTVWDTGPNPGRIAGAPSPTLSIAIDNGGQVLMVGADGSVWIGRASGDPTPVAGLSEVVAVSARSSLSDVFALRRDGTVWTWIPDQGGPAGTPQPIAGLANVVALGAHYAITGDCGAGGALWRIDRGGTAQAPKAVRVPGFGDGPGCTPPPTAEVAVTVSGQGRIVSAPAGIDCGSRCVARLAQGDELRLHEAPAAGWRFSGWQGAGCSARIVTGAAALACTAVFVEGGERRLSVRIDGNGRVASTPAGIDCGDDCTQSYHVDTPVTLVATPSPGHAFLRFAGDDDCADGVLAMDAVKGCVALFEPLAAPPAPTGFAAAPLGTAAALRWDADNGGVVERYVLERADASGVFVVIAERLLGNAASYTDTSTTPSTRYTYRLTAFNSRGASPAVGADVTTLAEALPTLDVSIAGTGNGSVISVPRGITCGSDCSETYAAGQVVTLFADGNFARWEGCDQASGNRCVVTMNGARRVAATFDAGAAPRFVLTVVKQGTGAVVSTPSGIECGLVCVADFGAGTVVTLSGSAQFAGANGCDQIIGNQCTVTMDRSRGVAFGGTGATPPQFTLTVTVDRAGGFVGTTDGAIGCAAPNTCSARYATGTAVSVYASAQPGANVALEAWQGDCAAFGAQTNITLTMNRDMSCRAVFVSGP